MILKQLQACLQQVNQVLLGKEHAVRLSMCCLLAKGHLLIEDLPGMGKTTLSHALAQVLGLSYRRVQFTSDLLPGDILGTSIFEPDNSSFVFHPGPIFTQLLLADEINRATPKSQSALLEAMEERQVSIEGQTRALPQPFFVIATQNPVCQSGTFALPESQLDRFLMRLSLGYPGAEAERALLSGACQDKQNRQLQPQMQQEQLLQAQQLVSRVKVTEPLISYVLRLVEATRNWPEFVYGLSPRGGLALLAAAKAWAFLAGRDYVIPEDVQTVLPHVAGHRLALAGGAGQQDSLLERLLAEVPAL